MKISQLKFLVMTEKNIFVYKLFLSINISDFSYFLCKTVTPSPLKKSPPLSQQLPCINWDPTNPPFFEICSEPPQQKEWGGGGGGGGAHYVATWSSSLQSSLGKCFQCRKWILCCKIWVWYIYTRSDLFLMDIVARVCCCNWVKLRLLAILLKILLITLSWYPFSFNICFILAFSLVKPYLLMIKEYALLKREETTLSLQLLRWWEM